MKTKMLVIGVFAEQCYNAGELVGYEWWEKHGLEWGQDHDDIMIFRGTPEEIMRDAEDYYEMFLKERAGTDMFCFRAACTLASEAVANSNLALPAWHKDYEEGEANNEGTEESKVL